ncbi:MAG: hypothetical protein ACLQF1_20410 [Methyloceanibacter sp.]
MDYPHEVAFMRSYDCAIAGPGKALLHTDVRSMQTGELIAKWDEGKLKADL